MNSRAPAREGLASAATELPFIDEHCRQLHGSVDVTWTSLLHVLRRQMAGTGRLYRIVVIKTGAHRLITRRLLRQVASQT